MEDLLQNHTYLLRYGNSDTISSITILMITDKAYKVRWNNSISETWELKRRISFDYSFVEDISDFIAPKLEDLKYEITYKRADIKCHPFLEIEDCKTCKGEGQIPDDSSTSCHKTCPACNGSKKQLKRVDFFFD